MLDINNCWSNSALHDYPEEKIFMVTDYAK